MPKKKTKTKKKVPWTKTIDGKRYDLGRIRKTKKSAYNVAESYRNEGYNARVVSGFKEGHGVFVRKRR